MPHRAQATEVRDALPRFQRFGVRGLSSMTRFYRSLPLREQLLVLGALVLPIPLALAGLAIPLLGSVARTAGSPVVLESTAPPPASATNDTPATRSSVEATTDSDDRGPAVAIDAGASIKTAGEAQRGGGPSAAGKPGATGNDGGGAGAPGRPDDNPADAGPQPGDGGAGAVPVPVPVPVPAPPLLESSEPPVAALDDGGVTVPVDVAGVEVIVDAEGLHLRAAEEELDVAPQVPVVNVPPLP